MDDKKKHSKKIIGSVISLGIIGGAFAQQDKRPNVVYVFPDQLRNHAMHFWNQDDFKQAVNFQADPVYTPNLDKFAHEAVVLTSAQSNCPLSSPHRGMMLTGMYPDGSGVPLNCNSSRPISNLHQDATTISDIFSQSGYDCAYIGKLHVDYPTPNNPQHPGTYVENRVPAWDAYTPPERRHGFNFWYSYGTFDVHKHPHYWDWSGNRHDVDEWSPTHETDKAIEYITEIRDKNKPFFLMIAMNPPHSPYRSLSDVPEQDYNRYKDVPLEKLLVRPNVNPALKKKQQAAPYYFASVTGVDREFGRILKALKDAGLDDNTIVVFTSDHGETMASHVEDPKNSPYAEAMNVPFLIRYPKKLRPHVSPVLLSTPDIMPTLLAFAGLKNRTPNSVQGRDLSGFLSNEINNALSPCGALYIRNVNGEKDKEGKITSYFPVARGIKTAQYTMAITIDKAKQIKEILFFDDVNDPYQMTNLSIKKHPETVKKLCTQMGVLLKQANDPWYREKVLDGIIHYE